MIKAEVVHNPATVVVESLLCQLETVGVCAVLDNTEVVEVRLAWASHWPDQLTWDEFSLPGGKEWLKDLYTAIGEMLYQIEYRQKKRQTEERIAVEDSDFCFTGKDIK